MSPNPKWIAFVFATDFLASSRLALDYAVAFARYFKATIIMVHALELSNPAREAETETSLPSLTRKHAEERSKYAGPGCAKCRCLGGSVYRGRHTRRGDHSVGGSALCGSSCPRCSWSSSWFVPLAHRIEHGEDSPLYELSNHDGRRSCFDGSGPKLTFQRDFVLYRLHSRSRSGCTVCGFFGESIPRSHRRMSTVYRRHSNRPGILEESFKGGPRCNRGD